LNTAMYTSDAYDLVVFDRCAPDSLPPGSYLFLGALPPLETFSSSGEAENPVVIDWDALHPISQYVSYANLFLERSMVLSGPDDAHTLVETDAGPLMLWWSSPSYRIVTTGFDMFASRWPLRPGFPIFLANAVRHLGGAQTEQEGRSLRAGRAIQLDRPDAEVVSVLHPDGATAQLPVEGGRATLGETTQCGPYVFDNDDEDRRATYVVNLLDSSESNIKPKDEIPWRRATLAGVAQALKQNREVWPWFVAAALAILMIEWYIYNRRAYL